MTINLLQLRLWLKFALPRHDDDTGASLVEYALLLALIAMVAVVALSFLGEATSGGLEEGRQGFAAN